MEWIDAKNDYFYISSRSLPGLNAQLLLVKKLQRLKVRMWAGAGFQLRVGGTTLRYGVDQPMTDNVCMIEKSFLKKEQQHHRRACSKPAGLSLADSLRDFALQQRLHCSTVLFCSHPHLPTACPPQTVSHVTLAWCTPRQHVKYRKDGGHISVRPPHCYDISQAGPAFTQARSARGSPRP